jgi:type II secretory pathway component GspD/PulD (secretin)
VKNIAAVVIVTLVAAGPVGAVADDPVMQGTSASATNQVPLRIQLVVSRHSGDKKLSSIPYTLSVVANDNDKTSLRMGVDVPVPVTAYTGPRDNATTPITSYNYRPVGTNIDCSAKTIDTGLFKLDLAVSDTSVFLADKAAGMNATAMGGLPAFRSFTSTFNVLLRDGQTAQHTAATDPVSGEVLRIDVTLNVLK